MERNDKNKRALFGEIGSRFRDNIKKHISNNVVVDKENVEWLLEPLDAISHSSDIVLGAFETGSFLGALYHLYFHDKNANETYYPGTSSFEFDDEDEDDAPTEKKVCNPYDKSMLIRNRLELWPEGIIPSIWEDLTVPFTEMGIWQAVLLNETPTLFPKWWHANYRKVLYVFSENDYQHIIRYPKFGLREFDSEKLASFHIEDILPSVEINGDEAIATYHYWNNWSGFCRRIIPMVRHGLSLEFGEEEREILVEYNCGIMF